jgi:hypothetical protein
MRVRWRLASRRVSSRASGRIAGNTRDLRVMVAYAVMAGAPLLAVADARAQDLFSAPEPGPPAEPGPFARMPDGRPDLSGNWSIAVSIGDISAQIVRIGGDPVAADARAIPYTPVYAELRAQAESRMFEEPELHCYMSGVPSHLWRQAYSGAGLIIQQSQDYIVFLHEFQGSRRIVSLADRAPIAEDIRLFMGDGSGHWDGDTLIIETTNNNAITWLDTGGNRHSDQLVVTERFTPINNDNYRYEATFVDAEAYSSSWTIAAPMTRGGDPDAEILEFACVEGNTDHLHYTEDVGGDTLIAPSPAAEAR